MKGLKKTPSSGGNARLSKFSYFALPFSEISVQWCYGREIAASPGLHLGEETFQRMKDFHKDHVIEWRSKQDVHGSERCCVGMLCCRTQSVL